MCASGDDVCHLVDGGDDGLAGGVHGGAVKVGAGLPGDEDWGLPEERENIGEALGCGRRHSSAIRFFPPRHGSHSSFFATRTTRQWRDGRKPKLRLPPEDIHKGASTPLQHLQHTTKEPIASTVTKIPVYHFSALSPTSLTSAERAICYLLNGYTAPLHFLSSPCCGPHGPGIRALAPLPSI
jgi:hypothetical protein